jgi:hypothetical protein
VFVNIFVNILPLSILAIILAIDVAGYAGLHTAHECNGLLGIRDMSSVASEHIELLRDVLNCKLYILSDGTG